MNCTVHPFKQCSFYNKKEDRLQCPLCLLPSDIQKSVIEGTTKPIQENSIIDIDLVESLAQSLFQEEDIHEDLNKLESLYIDFISEFQKNVNTIIDQLCQNLQNQLFQYIYQLRIKAEQQQLEKEDNQKLLAKIQEMRKKDSHECIESITSLQNQIIKTNKINHQQIKELSQQSIQILEQFTKQFILQINNINSQSIINDIGQLYDKNQKLIPKQNEQKSINSSLISQTGILSVDQIKKFTIQNQFTSNYILTSVVVLESQIIVGTKCGKIILYECNSFEELYIVEKAHKDSIKLLTRGKNDTIFVSGGIDKYIKIWEKCFDLEEKIYKINLKIDLEQQVSIPLCLTICEQIECQKQQFLNLLLVGSVDNTVRIWNLDNGQYFYTYSGHTGDVFCVTFVKKINLIASGSQDKTIRLWDGIQYKYSRPISKLTGHNDSILGLISLPEENQILSCGLDRTIRLWDCNKKCQLKLINTSYTLQKLQFLQIGVVIASSVDSKLRIYDYRISTMLHELNNQRKTVQAYCIDQDNKSILAINDNNINLFY